MDDEKDALWELLGRARRVEASPYFTRKVLRAIREEPRPAFSISMVLRWLLPLSACAAVVLGWSAYQHQREEAEFAAYFDTAADMESLVAYEDGASDGAIWMEEIQF